MKYRKLRIAWSVIWGVLCVLLIALWVWSYFWVNNVAKLSRNVPQWGVGSGGGLLEIRWRYDAFDNKYDGWMFRNISKAMADKLLNESGAAGGTTARRPWRIGLTGNGGFLFPYWLPVLIAGYLAAAPWVRWRFSLRTLLIITTVATVGLGWLAYAYRNAAFVCGRSKSKSRRRGHCRIFEWCPQRRKFWR